MLSFYEAILEGERRGWTRQEAAARLLLGIRQPFARGRVQAVCKVTHHIPEEIGATRARHAALHRFYKIGGWLSDDHSRPIAPHRREALRLALCRLAWAKEDGDRWIVTRQDTAPTPVPSQVWQIFEAVDADLKSNWIDDEDDPEQGASLDWIAGTLFDSSYWEEHPEASSCTLECSGLQIAPKLVWDLLSYTDEEIAAIVTSFPGSDGDNLWRELRADPKRGGLTQEKIRSIWRNVRNPTSKTGPRPSSRRVP